MNTISGSSENPLGITLVNVRYILAGSVALDHNDCVKECIEFIGKNLSLANCISFFTFGASNCRQLCKALLPFMWKNIRSLESRQEFLTLSGDTINCLLPPVGMEDPEGEVEKPELLSDLLLGIYKWSKVDPTSRLQHFAEISSQFPLSSVHADVLCKIFLEDACKVLKPKDVKSQLHGADGNAPERVATVATLPVSFLNTDQVLASPGKNSCYENTLKQKEKMVIRRSSRKIKRVDYSEGYDDEVEELQIDNCSKRSKMRSAAPTAKQARLEGSMRTSSKSSYYFDDDFICSVVINSQSGSEDSKRKNGLQELPDYSSSSQSLSFVETSSRTFSECSVANPETDVSQRVPTQENVIAIIDRTISVDHVDGTLQASEASQVMYFVSSRNEGNHDEIMAMDLKDFKVTKFKDLPDGMDCIYLLYYRRYIFAICTKTKETNGDEKQVVCCIDLAGKIRQCELPIRHPRLNSHCIVYNDGIYLLGGFNMQKDLSARVQKIWTLQSSLQSELDCTKLLKARADHAVALLGDNIYVVGGLVSGKNGPKLSASMEVCSREKVMRRKKSPMPTKRKGLCAVVVNSHIYAIGGGLKQSGTELNTCEVYNSDSDKWTAAAPLIQARQNAAGFVMDGNIVIVGGNRGPPTMEKYDIQSNKWTLMENCPLPLNGFYRSVAFTKLLKS